MPLERRMRLIAHQGDVAFEVAAGQRVDGDVGRLADLDVDDVGFVDLDFGGDDAHVGEGHQGGALGVLNADDDRFAFADGQVGDDAVEGRDGRRFCRARRGWSAGWPGVSGDLWPRAESVCALAWTRAAFDWVEGGDGEVVGGLLGVEVLLGDQLALVERLGAVPVELLLLEIGLGVLDVGRGGVFGRDEGGDIGRCGSDGGLLRWRRWLPAARSPPWRRPGPSSRGRLP